MSQLSLEEFKKFNKKIDKNIFKYIDIKNSINRKKTNMSTNPVKVNRAIKNALIFIKK
jgi:argininosuccinate lyase